MDHNPSHNFKNVYEHIAIIYHRERKYNKRNEEVFNNMREIFLVSYRL